MITCPWCGTNYTEFQSNCKNCGGPLPLTAPHPVHQEASAGTHPVQEPTAPAIQEPPAPPRPVPDNYAWQIMMTDGGGITAFVFTLLGGIFSVVGIGLTLGIVTAFVGIPFMGLGLAFLVAGLVLGVWRYNVAKERVTVLRNGQAVQGQITNIYANYNVRINHRTPWVVEYCFETGGQSYTGKVTTLASPTPGTRPGTPVYVLYMPGSPAQNTLFPAW